MISLVIPVFNEEESLHTLHEEITSVVRENGFEVDIIFVDDGSTDNSWKIISEMAAIHPEIRGIRFRRNFGKAAALAAGFGIVRGEYVLTMDADLQDDPKEIPRFLEALEEGKDVISGWKKVRHDPWHKVFPSRVFNKMVSWTTGVHLHDHNCGMKCYRAEVLKEIKLYGELHRFIPVLADARGFKAGEIVIQHRARKFGQSKYGFGRIFKGFLDLLTVKFLTGYGRRPQHLLGGFGLLCFFLGALGMAFLAITWIIRLFDTTLFTEPLHQRALLYYCLAFVLLGAQFMSVGFLAELMTAYLSKDQDSFSIAETTPQPEPDSCQT